VRRATISAAIATASIHCTRSAARSQDPVLSTTKATTSHAPHPHLRLLRSPLAARALGLDETRRGCALATISGTAVRHSASALSTSSRTRRIRHNAQHCPVVTRLERATPASTVST